ncbi:MAG: hypothetical protein KGL39_18125 [Patescibacteria group bacterium]|nr:hypothetical protein [Patescibacteria group bacterium]
MSETSKRVLGFGLGEREGDASKLAREVEALEANVARLEDEAAEWRAWRDFVVSAAGHELLLDTPPLLYANEKMYVPLDAYSEVRRQLALARAALAGTGEKER